MGKFCKCDCLLNVVGVVVGIAVGVGVAVTVGHDLGRVMGNERNKDAVALHKILLALTICLHISFFYLIFALTDDYFFIDKYAKISSIDTTSSLAKYPYFER